MYHIAVVEDEQVYTDLLRQYLQKYQKETGYELKLYFFSDGDEILEKYKAEYDIILMDIQMRFVDGMTAAEQIRQMDKDVIIMFITNMTSYAIRGYDVNALDYMVKPVEYFSFSQKLGRAIERIKKNDSHFIAVPIETGIQKLNIEEVYYVESFGHNLVFDTKQGEVQSRGTMKKIEDLLLPYGFFRCGKSYLVNMKYVDGVKGGCCEVNGKKLQISRQKKKEFMDALLDYMSEAVQ